MLQMQEMARLLIESKDNLQLKSARKVRDGRSAEMMFVEGLRLAEEAIRSKAGIEICIIRSGFGADDRQAEILLKLEMMQTNLIEVNERIFSTIAETPSPQGIVLICHRPSADRKTFESSLKRSTSSMDHIVTLYQISNPLNLGAVLRTAEAAGVRGVVISDHSADCFSPKALRASMGSAFRIPIWSNAELNDLLEFAAENGYRKTWVTPNGGRELTTLDWTTPRLIVFGSEAHGISNEVASNFEDPVTIPMESGTESLNLAVAAGVILYEARRAAKTV
jgi:TrmH family RNA methyltransferase